MGTRQTPPRSLRITPGSRREPPPPAPTDPRMTVSRHGARAVQLSGQGCDTPVREQPGYPLPDPCQPPPRPLITACLLYTSDAADDLTRVDLGGRRLIKKKK